MKSGDLRVGVELEGKVKERLHGLVGEGEVQEDLATPAGKGPVDLETLGTFSGEQHLLGLHEALVSAKAEESISTRETKVQAGEVVSATTTAASAATGAKTQVAQLLFHPVAAATTHRLRLINGLIEVQVEQIHHVAHTATNRGLQAS